MEYVGKQFVLAQYPQAKLIGFADEFWIEYVDANGELQEAETCKSPEEAWHAAALEIQVSGPQRNDGKP